MDSESIPVLIVDDDPTTSAVLRGLLRGLGKELVTEVTCVVTGAAARAEFKRGVHHLVLLDYLLPDEDGLTLLAAIHAMPENRRPVVVMLTGGGSEQVAVDAMKLGAKDYVIKTALNLPTLRRAILGALERRRLEQQLTESTSLLRRQHEQLEADLAMARQVQQALLPQHYEAFAAGDRSLRFNHRWIPGHQVAGDFFGVFPVSETAAGIFQCDVMGHGVRAALITALLRGLLREQQALAGDPGAFLGALNRQLQGLLSKVGDLVYVTAVYLVADTAVGEVRLANAGHPTPFHLERASGRVSPCALPYGPGPALGLMPDFVYDTVARPMAAGDAVLLFTDGVYEVEGPDGEQLGQTGLGDAITARLAQDTPQLLDGLLEDVKAYRGGGIDILPDDVCLVAVDCV